MHFTNLKYNNFLLHKNFVDKRNKTLNLQQKLTKGITIFLYNQRNPEPKKLNYNIIVLYGLCPRLISLLSQIKFFGRNKF